MRMCFLETVAGVPGMVAAMLRHLRSLRTMRRDNGWIHTLLEEAENERMHLLTFLQLRQPGPLFRGAVLVTQGAPGGGWLRGRWVLRELVISIHLFILYLYVHYKPRSFIFLF